MTSVKPIIFLFYSIVLTFIGGVLGGAPLSVVRQQVGALPYWLIGLGLSTLFWGLKLPALTVFFFINVLLIGILSEVRKRKAQESTQWISTVFLTYAIALVGVFTTVHFLKIDLTAQLADRLSSLLLMVPELAKSVSTDELVQQMPAVALSYLVFCLAGTLILEKSFFSWSDEAMPARSQLSQFRLPDSFIWILIASLLFAFGEFGYPSAKLWAGNALNVCLIAYFFQGLAVITRYFQVFKVRKFWRVFWYVLVAVQLFILVSVLGIIDYWVDFRKSFTTNNDLLKRKLKSKLGRGKSRGDSQ